MRTTRIYYKGLQAWDDWLVMSAKNRAAIMLEASDIMSRSYNVTIVRYASRQYAGFRMIDTPVANGINGKENPPPGCWGGFVMIGDYPIINRDIGAAGNPYYLTMPTRGKFKDGRIRTALVYPVSNTEKNLSNDYSYPVGFILNTHPCLQHDAVSNPAPQRRDTPVRVDRDTITIRPIKAVMRILHTQEINQLRLYDWVVSVWATARIDIQRSTLTGTPVSIISMSQMAVVLRWNMLASRLVVSPLRNGHWVQLSSIKINALYSMR